MAAASADQVLSELIIHMTGAKGQKLKKHLAKAKRLLANIRCVRPLKTELETLFWAQVAICNEHSDRERAEHLQEVADEALSMIDTHPAWLADTLQFLLELSPSPLEFQQVERRFRASPFEEVLQHIQAHDDIVLEQGVPGALGDSDSWSSADSVEIGELEQTDSPPDEFYFVPPSERNFVHIDERPLVHFYTIQEPKVRAAFQRIKGFGEDAGSDLTIGSIEKFHKRMAYLRKWLAMPMMGRSLTFQAFAGAIAEELDEIRREIARIEKLPNLTLLKLLHHLDGLVERPLQLCHICETVTSQPEPWLEAVSVLSHLSNESFFVKTAKPMLQQIRDLLVKGEFHEELLFDRSPQGDVIVRGPIPEKMFLHSYLDRVKMSAQCAVHYKEHAGRPLVDATSPANAEIVDIIGRVDALLKRTAQGIPVHGAAKAAILPLCKLVNTELVEKLKTEYDAFSILRRFQSHSFVVSYEMHTLAEAVFDGRCPREVGAVDSLLEDLVGPEWRVKSVEPFVIHDLLPWPFTIFTSDRNYAKVRTYILRVKEAAHALVHMDASELSPEEQIARFKIMCIIDLLNQHITLTAQECISTADLASGADIEEISRRHTAWFERTNVLTLMSPKTVRNTLDDVSQTALRFARERRLELVEKKFIPYVDFLAQSVIENLPVLAARLVHARQYFK
ncbi:hypothetical protein BIW11_00451 [Tropilaelaps mercedesae]|uniref:Uncharacterized protein n=1 Tax=Tropilaelaps mercedesae TaxID=418985 RepID=A0A1V9XVB7_9ACAR|nr:hypothetical protein BIW11_00451 [Tropilaelaps mercedesae]